MWPEWNSFRETETSHPKGQTVNKKRTAILIAVIPILVVVALVLLQDRQVVTQSEMPDTNTTNPTRETESDGLVKLVMVARSASWSDITTNLGFVEHRDSELLTPSHLDVADYDDVLATPQSEIEQDLWIGAKVIRDHNPDKVRLRVVLKPGKSGLVSHYRDMLIPPDGTVEHLITLWWPPSSYSSPVLVIQFDDIEGGGVRMTTQRV